MEIEINEYTKVIIEEEISKGLRIIISAKPPMVDVKIHASRQGKFYSVSVYVIRSIMYAHHPGHTALIQIYVEQHYWGTPAEYRFNKLMGFINLLLRDKEEQFLQK